MKKTGFALKSLIGIFLLFQLPNAFAQVRLPRLISNGMVLQRDQKINIWGWASPGEKVSISFNKKKISATTGLDGKWRLIFPAMKAGGPYTMQVDASNHISITNILLGDVWVCSGQSNMELPMARVKVKYEQVVAESANPNIRQFNVAMCYSFKSRQEDLSSGAWIEANPQSVLDFSAVAYFFARELYQKYKVPIGLIKSAVGGSPAEAWLSEDALKSYPKYLEITKKYKDSLLVENIKRSDADVVNNWNSNVDKQDKGLNEGKKWFASDFDASEWKATNVPGYWDEAQLFSFNQDEQHNISPVGSPMKNTNGVVWFRKEVNVPASMAGKPALLVLGVIVDRDIVYVNGSFAGTTGYQYPPRRYTLPAGLLKEGKNVIVIRVISNSGRGGFVKDKEYALKAGDQVIDLKGDWQYKLGYASAPMPGGGTSFQYQPAGLFNGMISPLLNYSIKGVIWYQGESNTGRPKEYQGLLSAVINDWRANWKQRDLPFLYVQLANFMQAKREPSESNWAELRDAQFKTLSIPNTAMAVITDVGEWNDIHPLNKETVGVRLALAAQKVAYGDKKVVHSGPIYQSHKIEGSKIILNFSSTGSGLLAKDGELKGFAIAGPDQRFVWATAKVEGSKVVVWNDSVQNPIAVRYAWADNPEGANLYNKEGLPASPFRTDN